MIVHVRIERIVLEGFAAGRMRRGEIFEAIEVELVRLLKLQPPRNSRSVGRVVREALDISSTNQPTRLGKTIAGHVHHVMGAARGDKA